MIKIIDNYYAEADTRCWVLLEKHVVTKEEAENRKNVQEGDIEYKQLTYHTNLINLLEYLFEKYKKMISKKGDLKSYIDELNFLQQDFIAKINKMVINNEKDKR